MTEKATERKWSHKGGPRLGSFGGKATVYDGPFEVAEMDVAYAEVVVEAMNAVNNYDELASIAGEMAEMMHVVQGDCIFVDDVGVADHAEVPHTRGDTFNAFSAALSRYNKWAEKNNG